MQLGKTPLQDLPKSKYLTLLPYLKKEKTQAFASSALTLIALILFGLFAISPTLSTITKLQKELKDSKFVKSALDDKIANLTTLQQKYNLLEKDVPMVLQALPKGPTIPRFVGQVQSLAKDTNVTVTNLQTFQVELQESEEQKAHSSFAFSVEVQGANQDITNFLSQLVLFDRVVTIDAFSIAKGSDILTKPRLSMRGKTYFKR